MNVKNGCKFLMLCALGASLITAKPSLAKSSMMKSSTMKSSKMMHPTQMTGVITGMTRTSLTVTPAMKAMGASKTVMIPRSAKIMTGAAPSSLSRLKAGEKVMISMNAKGAVTRVQVVAQSKPKMMKAHAKKM